MKIAFSTYPWAYFTPGGGEIQIEKLFEQLKKKGIVVQKFDQWIPQTNFDIYHYFSCMGGSFDFCNYLKSQKKNLLISSSLWIKKEKIIDYPIDAIINQLSLADYIIVNSFLEKNLLSEVTRINKNNFKVVHNGFDENLLKYNDTDLEPPKFLPKNWLGDYIFCLANIEKRKNQNVLVKAARKIGMKLLLAGHIRDEDYFESLNIKNNDNVFYVGPVKNRSKLFLSLFKFSRFFALPSKLETPGLAALEAAALGIPILITEEGSAKEYFGNINSYFDGKLCSLDDLCDKLNYLKSYPEKGIVDKKQISKFTWSKCADEQLKIYQDLI
tara:strand:+ start:1014 stop:1994 length:981 start_codon:yes stop_codon:yes gene_type:complete